MILLYYCVFYILLNILFYRHGIIMDFMNQNAASTYYMNVIEILKDDINV
jgi:hypothetical protein